MLDRIDSQLLTRLRDDGRASWKSLGDGVGLSADAVRVRVERLIAEGVARPVTLVDPKVFGYTTRVVLAVTTAGDATQFVEWASRQNGLTHLVRVAGRYSFIAEYVAQSLLAAHDFANVEVMRQASVTRVEMMPIIDVARWREDTRPNWMLDGSTAELSAMDVQVLECLVDEPRIGLTELAARLEQPYAQVRRRVLAMYGSGIIRATAVTDDAASGAASAFFQVRRKGDWSRTRDALLEQSEATIIVATAGRFAFVGELVGRDLMQLDAAAASIASRSDSEVEYLPFVHVEKLPASLSFHRTGDG